MSRCDSGTHPTFDYNVNSLGRETVSSGSFTMESRVNNDQQVMDSLLSTIETALLKTQKCTTTKGQKCAFGKKRSPDSGPELHDCHGEQL